MRVASLFLHNMQASSPGWHVTIAGDLQLGEQERIDAIFSKHVKREEVGGYNTWMILAFGDSRFSVRRFTWEFGGFGPTLEDVERQLNEYYANMYQHTQEVTNDTDT